MGVVGVREKVRNRGPVGYWIERGADFKKKRFVVDTADARAENVSGLLSIAPDSAARILTVFRVLPLPTQRGEPVIPRLIESGVMIVHAHVIAGASRSQRLPSGQPRSAR